ncbi:helix-turn-helix transcriptional regulator [Actinomadura rudentiformis]|uniref:Helix-turn-helix domain-containing protein n=1 Tax=Actinomadura rudentiformis TaxID=359158 RepID=A0A6H9Y8P8_9ACTN|nr:helix-turn-helix transcriptional regulator [Actinomadura rudentiformis]KAB2340574.1 helix-turn-helix domain-containing protein [Actinomadura rudentiformis]
MRDSASLPDSTTLGDFLRSRRNGLKPEELGIAHHGLRRVPGLRREELAQLAGVSPTYYTRLEQGQSHQASTSVLEALADALRLTDAERAHLHRLARPEPSRPRRSARTAPVRPSTRRLLDSMENAAAVLTDHRTDVLAWNRLGHLLLAGHLDPEAPDRPSDRPNLTRMLFLDAHHRDLHPRWNQAATCAVAALRNAAGRHRGDRRLAGLIGELTMNSTEFATLWSKHSVGGHAYGERQLSHPEVGDITLDLETLTTPDGSGHRILIYSAPEGSPAQAALRLLQIQAQRKL